MGRNSGVRIAAAIVGATVGAPLVIGGALLLWAQGTQRDADGFYRSGDQVIASAGRAVTVSDVDIDPGPPLASDAALDRQLTLRLAATARDGEPVFIGVGPRDEVTRWLDGVARDEVTELDGPGNTVESRYVPGSAVPAPPAAQTFWTAASSGAGEQVVSWPVRAGHWTVVVLKADGSAGLDLAASAGIRIDFLTPVALGLVAVGGLVLLGAAAVLVLGTRAEPNAPRPQPARVA